MDRLPASDFDFDHCARSMRLDRYAAYALRLWLGGWAAGYLLIVAVVFMAPRGAGGASGDAATGLGLVVIVPWAIGLVAMAAMFTFEALQTPEPEIRGVK